jgi:hypothetical protein
MMLEPPFLMQRRNGLDTRIVLEIIKAIKSVDRGKYSGRSRQRDATPPLKVAFVRTQPKFPLELFA